MCLSLSLLLPCWLRWAPSACRHPPTDLQGTIPYEPYDAELLGPLAPACRIIASASAGYNEFALDWMTRHGIYFTNTLSAVSEATADLALFLVLATVRATSLAEHQARCGGWKAGLTPSDDTYGKVLGLVGMGAIGRVVAEKARGFGMRVVYFQRRRVERREEERLGVGWCGTLGELLRTADIVSIHVPLNEGTRDMISTEQFEGMKEGCYLVNTARGAIVNQDALIAALKSGKVRRTGLDVFEDEPRIDAWFVQEREKVVLQPHMGGLTVSAFAKSERECLENIRALFEKGVPNSPVNEPEPKGVSGGT